MNHTFITQNYAYPLAVWSNLQERARLQTQTDRNPFPSHWSSCNMRARSWTWCFLRETKIPVLNREKICWVLWDRHLVIFCVCWDRSEHATHRRRIGGATLGAACCFWLNGHFPLQWYWEHWIPKCVSTSSWYNDYFSCWFLPNVTFGNIFVGFPVTHSENTYYLHSSQLDSLKYTHTHIHGYILYACL